MQALGLRVGVIGSGVIDASGETGGGTVLVGGDYKGGNAAVQNAESTSIGPDGVIVKKVAGPTAWDSTENRELVRRLLAG